MERMLSGVERMMYIGSEQVCANGITCARIRGPLDAARLRLSLDRLPRKHPLLATRVIRKHEALMFTSEAVPPIPLRILSGDGSDQSFLEVAATEVLTPLDRTTGPLARFTLIRHPDGQRADLLMASDHTIADGIACLYAIRDLLSAHESPELGIDPAPLSPHIAPPLPASTSDLVLGLAELASAPTRELVRRCREQSVSVHAAVCVAFAASFAALCENKTKVIVSSPVSYRHRLDSAVKDTVCCAVAFAQLHVDLGPPSSFWEQARAVRQQLLPWSTDERLFDSASALAEASQAEPDDARFLQRARQSGKSYDFSISNFGRQPIPSRYGELTITALHGVAALPGEIVVTLAMLDETMYISWMTRGLPRAASEVARQMVASALSGLGALPA